MRVEHLKPEIFDAQHGNELQNKVYAVYAREDGIKTKPLVTTFAKGEDTVIYLAALDQKDLLGHMHLEIGSNTFVHEVANIPSNSQLMLASGFTVQVELDRKEKIDIQRLFWDYTWALAELYGYEKLMIILNSRSASFAKKTGYTFSPSGFDFNWDSPTLQEFSANYPGYWKDNPELFYVQQ